MTNSRVLLKHVPLVRRLLASSESSQVVTVGTLGEITFLVDEHVTQVDLQILESLVKSVSSQDGRAFAARRLQQQRDALQPYVGKHLLKAGLTCVSRQYEVFVDPKTESIVHLSGFNLPDGQPEEPVDASPADRARWIFDHPCVSSFDDGQRVVELLLAGRDAAALTPDELLLLGKGYNWWGHNAKAFEVAKVGLTREPHSSEWLSLARLYLWNAYFQNLPQLLTACDACMSAGVGPAAFWHLVKADHFLAIATGELELEEYEWSPGDLIRHPEFLQLAAESLAAALACQPGLREQEAARSWVGDWNARFAAVLQEPEFRRLAQ